MNDHQVVSSEQWRSARLDLLAKEKEFTRLRDQLSKQRRELPWEEVTAAYRFAGPDGHRTLSQLFDGRSQLIVYHFMFPADWDAGCPHCSFWADNFDGIDIHLAQRDVSFAAVSIAPLEKITGYGRRMGWTFRWYSSAGSDFNRDLGVSFTPEELADRSAVYNYAVQDPGIEEREGVSVFYQDTDGRIFHTYSAYARGIDMLNGAYHFLDLTPKGRDESGHDDPQFWVRRHDEYTRT